MKQIDKVEKTVDDVKKFLHKNKACLYFVQDHDIQCIQWLINRCKKLEKQNKELKERLKRNETNKRNTRGKR